VRCGQAAKIQQATHEPFLALQSKRVMTVHQVAIVLDPQFAEKLGDLAASMPVWVVDTPENRRIAELLWAQSSRDSIARDVTTAKADSTEATPFLLSRLLSLVDLHHGEFSHDPPWTLLHVYGVQLCPSVEAVLAEFGIDNIQAYDDHFVASRVLAS
jgi:hypothetical protein